VGDWGSSTNEFIPPPPLEEEGGDIANFGLCLWGGVFAGDPTVTLSPVSVFTESPAVMAVKSLFFFRNTRLSLSLSVLGGKGDDFLRRTLAMLAERPTDADEAWEVVVQLEVELDATVDEAGAKLDEVDDDGVVCVVGDAGIVAFERCTQPPSSRPGLVPISPAELDLLAAPPIPGPLFIPPLIPPPPPHPIPMTLGR
jgi:hypothetical protein